MEAINQGIVGSPPPEIIILLRLFFLAPIIMSCALAPLKSTVSLPLFLTLADTSISCPGDHILSTYPTNFFPLNFSLTGYEIKNAPVKLLRWFQVPRHSQRQLPEITLDEIKARLMAGTKSVTEAMQLLSRPRPTLLAPSI